MGSNPTKALRDLLLWCRKERIVLSQVTIGSVTVVVDRDHGLVPPAAATQTPERKLSILEQYAGPLLKQPEQAPTQNEPTEEDE